MAETNNQWQYFHFSYINVLTYLLSCTSKWQKSLYLLHLRRFEINYQLSADICARRPAALQTTALVD